MKLIGISGFAGSGKGTVADILIEEFGYTKISFASKVKDCAALVFGWPRHLLEGDTKESRDFREQKDNYWSKILGYDTTPRLILQLIGTNAFRAGIHDDIWIMATFHEINQNLDKKYVIPDVRFPNEIHYIRKHGGNLFRVKRGSEPSWYNQVLETEDKDILRKTLQVHESEWAWIGDHFDIVIENDGNLDDLKSKVYRFVE